MITKTIKLSHCADRYSIVIGRSGENEATTIAFDTSDFEKKFGAGRAELVHRVPGTAEIYPISLVNNGDMVEWIVNSSDTSKVGSGEAEIRWFVGSLLAKSAIIRTQILPSMTGAEGNAPDPVLNWIDGETEKIAQLIASIKYLDDENAIRTIIAAYLEENPQTDFVKVQQMIYEYVSPEFEKINGAFLSGFLTIGEKADESSVYTKDESDGRFQPKGNYAIQGNTYTKTEVDNKVSDATPKDYVTVKTQVQTNTDAISSQSEEIAKKIDKPIDAPSVGKVLKIKSVNEDGTFVCEWADAPEPDLSDYMPKDQLMDAGIKSISWTTNLEGTFTTVEDPLKAQRPEGTNLRYWVEMDGWRGRDFFHETTYRVIFDGVTYDNLACKHGIVQEVSEGGTGTTYGMIGNKHLYDSRYYDTKEPFCILYIAHDVGQDCPYYFSKNIGNVVLLTENAKTFEVKVQTATITQNNIPKSMTGNYGLADDTFQKYSDGSTYPSISLGVGNVSGRDNYCVGSNNIAIGGNGTTAIGRENKSTVKAISIGFQNESGADGKSIAGISIGSSNKSIGNGSVAIGTSCVSSGDYSYSEGQSTIASGRNSHAEGGFYANQAPTTASGNYSHAEGVTTLASGDDGSHAEGASTIASNSSSHAEGNITVASGAFAHAEGQCSYAFGTCSHSEGRSTFASNSMCHAEGANTEATQPVTHVQGANNIVDNTKGGEIYYGIYDKDHKRLSQMKIAVGKYLHIVGNGTSDTKRSNAHTLDWNGNAWYQGDVYVGGTSQENGTKLVKETGYELILDDTATEDTIYNLIFDKKYIDIIIYVSIPTGNIQPTFTPILSNPNDLSIEIAGTSTPATGERVIVARVFMEHGRWRGYRSNGLSFFYNTIQERYLGYYARHDNFSDRYIDRFVQASSPIKTGNRIVIYGRRAD